MFLPAAPSDNATQPASTEGESPCVSPLAWLLGVPPPHTPHLQAAEQAVLDTIEAALRQRELPPNLVPRASAVIPQLLRLLRQPQTARSEIVARVSRDLALKTEVLRLAQSAYYRTLAEVDSLDSAVMVLGTSGLQLAIARVVLKPIFDGTKGDLTSMAAGRAWQLSEHQADCCAQLADQHGLNRFEGFLAGTLHGMGRTALLRLLDRANVVPVWPCSQALDQALNRYSHQLFGRLVVELNITPMLTTTGQLLARDGMAGGANTLAGVLRASEILSSRALQQQDAAAAQA